MEKFREHVTALSLSCAVILFILISGCSTAPSGDPSSHQSDRTDTLVTPLPDSSPSATFPFAADPDGPVTRTSETRYPSISLQNISYRENKKTEFSFKFQKDTYTVSIPVNGTVYGGAHLATKTMSGSWENNDDITGYYRALSNDPVQDELYRSITSRLEEIKSRKGLNDDWYLRLMVAFVQQIPYDDDAAVEPRFPVEVIYDGKGDCDEKTLLLMGLMQRSGYDVALLAFPQEQHMAAGVRVQVMDPRKISSFPIFSGPGGKYTYIETTAADYIGNCADTYKVANKENRVRVIGLTQGGKVFSGINYESQALSGLHRSREVIEYYDELEKTRGWLSNPEIEKYNACVRVWNYVSTHAFDLDGALWYIDNNHILDPDFLAY